MAAGFALADDASRSEAAIPHTADIARSNPRLAALMLHCGREGVEAVVVVVEPFPPHARAQITLRTPGQECQFIGNDYAGRRGNSVARRRDELGDRPPADGV